jgi:hypothetical protein
LGRAMGQAAGKRETSNGNSAGISSVAVFQTTSASISV